MKKEMTMAIPEGMSPEEFLGKSIKILALTIVGSKLDSGSATFELEDGIEIKCTVEVTVKD